jgi:ketosteroid isomerase-like protein
VTRTGAVTVETLQRLVDAFNAHDLDAVMSFFAADAVLEMPRGPQPWGRRLQGREVGRAPTEQRGLAAEGEAWRYRQGPAGGGGEGGPFGR